MWIESHSSLRSHPKLHKLKNGLKINQAQAIGHLHLLWWWCMDYAPDGNLTKYTETEIAIASGWEKNVTQYVTLLKQTGFLDTENEQVCIHDWKRYRLHFDAMLEKREQRLFRTKERVKKWREKHKTCNAPVTPACNAPVTPCNAPTIPNQPNLTKPNLTIPTELAELLQIKIKINNPSAVLPATTTAWAKDIEKLHRIDAQDYPMIRKVLEWSQSDDFWKSNILSGEKLRKQWNKLTAKMNIGGSHGTGAISKKYANRETIIKSD